MARSSLQSLLMPPEHMGVDSGKNPSLSALQIEGACLLPLISLLKNLNTMDQSTLFSEPSSPPILAASNIPILHLGAAQKIVHTACRFKR